MIPHDPTVEKLAKDLEAREHGLTGPLRKALLKLRAQNPGMESGVMCVGAVLTFASPPELPNVMGGVLLSQNAGGMSFVALAKNGRAAKVLLKRTIDSLNEGQVVMRRFATRLEFAPPEGRRALEELLHLHVEAAAKGWTVVPGGFMGGIQRLDEGWWARAYYSQFKVVLPKPSHVRLRSRIRAFPEGVGLVGGDLPEVLIIACAIDEQLLDRAETALLSDMAAGIRENDQLGEDD